MPWSLSSGKLELVEAAGIGGVGAATGVLGGEDAAGGTAAGIEPG